MKLRTIALITAALIAPVLSAQESPRFGLQAGINIPQGDLSDAVDSKLGLNVGGHMMLDFRGGHMLRPRVDYTWFPEYNVGGASIKFSNLSLGADYLYFVDGKPEDFYFTGGLALVQWKAEVNSASETTNKLGLAIGGGYQFNKTVGVELRYLKSKVEEANLDTIQAGVTFQF